MTRLFKVTVNGREYDVAVLEVTPGTAPAHLPGASLAPAAPEPAVRPAAAPAAAPAARAPAAAAQAPGSGADEVAGLGGVIVQVNVKPGQRVAVGDDLLVLEAMKMKNHLQATRAGQVTRVLVATGDAVEAGQPLLTIE